MENIEEVETQIQELEENLQLVDIEEDYTFARDTYRDLIDTARDSLEQCQNLASEMESPRAFEVLSTMLANTAMLVEKLMQLQKQRQDLTNIEESKNGGDKIQNQQNNFYVGDTAALQRMIKDGKAG